MLFRRFFKICIDFTTKYKINFFLTCICLASGLYCSDGYREEPYLSLCVNNSRTVTSSYIYLDTTGAPAYSVATCSCELEFQYTCPLTVRYRTENQPDCGFRFELRNRNNDSWSCEDYSVDDEQVVSVQALSKITFFRSKTDVKHVRACMGLKPGYGWLTVHCLPWQAYTSSTTSAPATTTITGTTTPATTTTTTPSTTTPTSTTTYTTSTTTPTSTTSTTTTTSTTPTTTPTTTTTSTPTTKTTPTTTTTSTLTTTTTTTTTSTPTTTTFTPIKTTTTTTYTTPTTTTTSTPTTTTTTTPITTTTTTPTTTTTTTPTTTTTSTTSSTTPSIATTFTTSTSTTAFKISTTTPTSTTATTTTTATTATPTTTTTSTPTTATTTTSTTTPTTTTTTTTPTTTTTSTPTTATTTTSTTTPTTTTTTTTPTSTTTSTPTTATTTTSTTTPTKTTTTAASTASPITSTTPTSTTATIISKTHVSTNATTPAKTTTTRPSTTTTPTTKTIHTTSTLPPVSSTTTSTTASHSTIGTASITTTVIPTGSTSHTAIRTPVTSSNKTTSTTSRSSQIFTDTTVTKTTENITTPLVAGIDNESSNTAAILGGVVGGGIGLILLILLVACILCIVRHRSENQKDQNRGGSSNVSTNYAQITENTLFPGSETNQHFIRGIPSTSGTRDSDGSRLETRDRNSRRSEIDSADIVNGILQKKINFSTFGKGSGGSEVTDMDQDNEYCEIGSVISRQTNNEAPYVNTLRIGRASEEAESVISSPYANIDDVKLDRNKQEPDSSKQFYVRFIYDPNDAHRSRFGIESGHDSGSGQGNRLASKLGPGEWLNNSSGYVNVLNTVYVNDAYRS